MRHNLNVEGLPPDDPEYHLKRNVRAAVYPTSEVPAWAEQLGVSISTAWRRLKGAMERRAKLDEGDALRFPTAWEPFFKNTSTTMTSMPSNKATEFAVSCLDVFSRQSAEDVTLAGLVVDEFSRSAGGSIERQPRRRSTCGWCLRGLRLIRRKASASPWMNSATSRN